MRVQPGDRVRLTDILPEDPAPPAVGAEGTVTHVDNVGSEYEQISVDWDSGRTLMLLPGDPFEVIPKR